MFNIYAMLLPEGKNIDFAKKNGAYKNKNLSVRSFKVLGRMFWGREVHC